MSVKTQLDDPNSSLRRFFTERLPGSPDVSRDYREQLHGAETSLPLAPPHRPPWSVLGHAISARLLWELRPDRMGEDIAGISIVPNLMEPSVGIQLAEYAALEPRVVRAEDAAMVAWIAGLVDMVGRTGLLDDPLYVAVRDAGTWDSLSDLVPASWIADIVSMTGACLPLIEGHRSPDIWIAPTFAGSVPVGGADADYITADGPLRSAPHP